MSSFAFSARMKLKSSQDFRHVMSWRVKLVENGMVAYMRPNSLGWNRLGVSVGKRHGNAIRRNYLKRLVREAFRLGQVNWWQGVDLVCVPSVQVSHGDMEIKSFLLKVGEWIQRQGPPKGGCHGPV